MKTLTKSLMVGFASTIFAASAFAGQVTLINNSAYEVTINGATYSGNNQYAINDLENGNYLIAIYQVTNTGIFGVGKKRSLIDSKQFALTNNNVAINVNQNGNININRNGYQSSGDRKRDRSDTGVYTNKKQNNKAKQCDNDDHDGDDKRYGNSEGKGNGNKYGHYKNKKDKSKHRNDD